MDMPKKDIAIPRVATVRHPSNLALSLLLTKPPRAVPNREAAWRHMMTLLRWS